MMDMNKLHATATSLRGMPRASKDTTEMDLVFGKEKKAASVAAEPTS